MKRILRDDNIPIELTGERIGYGHTQRGDYETAVRIWRSHGGTYVAGVYGGCVYAGQYPPDSYRAAVCSTPADCIAWLRSTCGGALGPASREAIAEAADVDDAFGAAAVERVA